MRAFFRFLIVCWLGWFADSAGAREFDFKRDTFAFSNDTVLSYGVDEQGALRIRAREKPVEFGHRCFVLGRAVLQFHQFAQFAAEKPRLTREQYRVLVRQICRIPVWSKGPVPKILVPGYRDLRDFSIAYEGLLKENLGNWLPCYFRVGNWRMIMGHLRCGQAAAAQWLIESHQAHRPRAIYLARFPFMNHVVIVYDMQSQPNGDLHFCVYDPNYPAQPAALNYIQAQRSFEFPKRWYFAGGRVNVMRVFISPFH